MRSHCSFTTVSSCRRRSSDSPDSCEMRRCRGAADVEGANQRKQGARLRSAVANPNHFPPQTPKRWLLRVGLNERNSAMRSANVAHALAIVSAHSRYGAQTRCTVWTDFITSIHVPIYLKLVHDKSVRSIGTRIYLMDLWEVLPTTNCAIWCCTATRRCGNIGNPRTGLARGPGAVIQHSHRPPLGRCRQTHTHPPAVH